MALESDAQSVRRAERALRSGDLAEAMTEAQGALEADPEDYRVHDVLARIHLAMAAGTPPDEYVAHIGEMLNSYDQVVALRPREEQKLSVQMINFWITEFNNGIAQFNNARGAPEDSSTWYYLMSAAHFEAASMAQSDSIDSQVNWAYALLGAGDEVAAIEPLQNALALGGPDIDSYSLLARIMLTNERAEEAVPLLEQALFEDGLVDTGLQDLLLNAYAQTQQTERALGTYEQAVLRDPGNKIYRYNFGSLLLENQQYAQAIEQLQAAVDLDSVYLDALYNLGAAHINLANDIQKQVNEKDDWLRENGDSISEEEQAQRAEEIDVLIQERVAMYEASVEPLEAARAVAELEGAESLEQVCFALYQAYAQTNQMDKVTEVQVCAGI